MNPYLSLGRAELENMLFLHGYACVSPDGSKHGYGPSTWQAMLNAFGHHEASLYAEVLNEGGTMTQWLPLDIACADIGNRCIETCEIQNSDGETLCFLYR
jgi:hypothetical protein